MANQTNRTQARQQWDAQLSREEIALFGRWRLMIDRAGGQQKAAKITHSSKSVISRDFTGQTLPNNERIWLLSKYLGLKADEQAELEVLLRSARDAKEARKAKEAEEVNEARGANGFATPEKTPVTHPNASLPNASLKEAPASASDVPRPVPSAAPPPDLAQQSGPQRPRGRWPFTVVRTVAVTATAAVVVVATAALTHSFASSPDKSPQTASSTPSTSASVQESNSGKGLTTVQIPITTVQIPIKSLAPTLQTAFSTGKTMSTKSTVTGYEFRNALNPSLCLTAADTGPLAGEAEDPVELAACKLAATQVWIPQQWDIKGQSDTHLVSSKYQSMCLTAEQINGTAGPGSPIMLQKCKVPAGFEAWDFRDWYETVAPGYLSYPLCLSNAKTHCIDADERSGVPAGIRLWTKQTIADQLWS